MRSGCGAEVGLCWHLDGPGAWNLGHVTCQGGGLQGGEARRVWRTGLAEPSARVAGGGLQAGCWAHSCWVCGVQTGCFW